MEDTPQIRVRLSLPSGEQVELEPGDIVGRTWSCALYLDDPRISEAHALVSLRDQGLKLLALRGRFAVEGRVVSEVELVPGLQIHLTPTYRVKVEAVVLPSTILALEADRMARHVLSGVCAITVRPLPEVLPGDTRDADAWVWSTGLGWSMRLAREDSPRPVLPGDSFDVCGHEFRVVAIDLEEVANRATQLGGSVQSPLRIVANYDSVHIHGGGVDPLVLGGMGARLLSELVIVGGPVSWQALAGELWPDEADLSKLRGKLDVTLARVRKKLRGGRVRPDLVRANGSGQFELVLHSRDLVEDNS